MLNKDYKQNLVNVFKRLEGSDLPYLVSQHFRNVQYWVDNIPLFVPCITYDQIAWGSVRIGQWSEHYTFTDESLREVPVQQSFLRIVRRISYAIQCANKAMLQTLSQPITCIKKPLPAKRLISMGQIGFHQIIAGQGLFRIHIERNNNHEKPDFFAPHQGDYIFVAVTVDFIESFNLK